MNPSIAFFMAKLPNISSKANVIMDSKRKVELRSVDVAHSLFRPKFSWSNILPDHIVELFACKFQADR
jgi:hypothetical protein